MTPTIIEPEPYEKPVDEKPTEEKPVAEVPVDVKAISISDPIKTLSEVDSIDPVKVEDARKTAWARPALKSTRDTLRTNRIKAAGGK
jgi:hypothetical protein